MPIYEFYCGTCNQLLNFYARKVNTTTLPPCPHCGTLLSRQVSHFSSVKMGDCSDELGDAPFDSDRMQNAVDGFGDSLDSLGEGDDPRKSAEMMRKFSEASGLGFNADIRDAMRRLENGEDPESVEADMEAIIGSGENAFAPGDRNRAGGSPKPPPGKDPTLYEM